MLSKNPGNDEPPQLTKAAFKRILARVSSRHRPADLDCAELWGALRAAEQFWHGFNSPQPFDAQRRTQLEQATKRARELRDFIKKNDLNHELWVADFAGSKSYCEAIDRVIDGLEAALRVQLPSGDITMKVIRRGASMPPGTGLHIAMIDPHKSSANKWLVGTHLPELFEEHFKKKPGISFQGPYTHFAEQVLIELHAAISKHTIVKYLSDARAAQTHPES